MIEDIKDASRRFYLFLLLYFIFSKGAHMPNRSLIEYFSHATSDPTHALKAIKSNLVVDATIVFA